MIKPSRLGHWPLVLVMVVCATGSAAWLWGCGQATDPTGDGRTENNDPGDPWFEEATQRFVLTFTHDAGPVGSYFMPQAIGSGAALFDFNNDGLLDIYLLQNGGPNGAKNRLFQQMPDHTFKDVSEDSGLDIAGYNMGVAVGDINNDGLPDVVVTQYGGVRLFLNLGGGKFRDVTEEAGLKNPAWGVSAAFFDFNRDGWLDLVVVNYVDYDPTWPCPGPDGKPEYCAPATFPGRVTRLFRNLGRQGDKKVRFEDVTERSGLGRLAGPGLGVVCADFNGDGWPDILVANDGKPNYLWINQHDGTFKEEAVTRNLAFNVMGHAQGNMGIAVGDVNGDGMFDVLITHLTEETHTLWLQGPRGFFQDRTAASRLAHPRWHATGFGTVLGDFNQDGGLDLAVVNGRVSKAKKMVSEPLGPHWGLYAERNQLFANDGKGEFKDISHHNPAFCGTYNVARGLACGDIDGDGALDLLVTTIAGPARIYRNIAPNRGNWLMVRAIDPALQRDAYGAEIRVKAGGRTQLRWINPGSSYLCSNDVRAHFGLGNIDRFESIEVLWPDGASEIFPGDAANQKVILEKRKGTPKK
jgi:hypothetical protein